MTEPAETPSDALSALVAGLVGATGPTRVVLLRQVRDAADAQIGDEVRRLSRRHYSWQAIADLLGVTRQAAWKRYGRDG